MIRRMMLDELNALPVADRAQAFVGNSGTLTRLVPKDDPGAVALMRFNPDYFDDTLPRSTVQLITLRFG